MSMYKLIIQGSDIATQNLKRLAQLAGASQIEAVRPGQLAHQAFKLSPANPAQLDAVHAFCAEAGYECACLPDPLPLSQIGLLVMDMDSTLITIECIDEIADMLGIKPQVAAITERSMRGEIDFRQSLTERVALLAGLDESALKRVYTERLQLMPGAQTLLTALQKQGVKTLLISGGFTFFTDRLKARLGLTEAIANTLEVVDGKLTGRLLGELIDAQSKADELVRLREELGLRNDQVIAIGDGANDLKMLAAAGFGIACHAKPLVRTQARYCLDSVGLDGVLAFFD
ncbi:phosphoserine phosphatase SerB [Chitinimonas sp.]|uniref:phosphoserine phosphatase SerB n=1 Tax=Chitinimonas sp. TaxID=1934313 RepID=UPI0035B44542